MTDVTGADLRSPESAFGEPSGLLRRRDGLLSALQLLRPHQWVKNAFVAAPLFFTPAAVSAENLLLVLAGVVSFCFIASAVYILNDYMDREADRIHPTKRSRPIASGAISVSGAFSLFVGMLAIGFGIASQLDSTFLVIAVLYLLVNVGYSLGLKDVSLLDVLTIASGFVLRVLAGAALINVELSVWIIMCTGLVALFLALAKRRDDVARSLGTLHRQALAGYTKPFLDAAISIVLGALFVAYMLYTTEAEVAERMGTDRLYFTVPFVIAGILRYLQIALVEERSGAPTKIVLSDRFLIVSVLLWGASFTALTYLGAS